eukprot:10299952-Alexandrium_andersonii.AAC.1
MPGHGHCGRGRPRLPPRRRGQHWLPGDPGHAGSRGPGPAGAELAPPGRAVRLERGRGSRHPWGGEL